MKWSVLYESRGAIHRIGPFDAQDAADLAAKAACDRGEFSIHDQRVYLMTPDHRLIEYSMAELAPEVTEG